MEEHELLRLYKEDISTALLNAEEERELFAAARRGDNEAREQIILANLRLVLWEAKRHEKHGLPLLDLIGVGNLALLRAIDKFEGGCRFATYAVPWLRGAMLHAIHEAHTVPLPERTLRQLKPLDAAIAKIGQELGTEPTLAQVAAAVGLTENEVSCIARAQAVLSLNDEEEPLQVAGLEDAAGEALSLADGARASKLLKYLRTRERQVISAQFGLGDAEMPAIKERRREQIVQSGLAKLRELMEMGTETLTQAACLPCPHYRKVGGRAYCARTGATIVITDPLPSECQNALKTKPI